MLKIFGQISVEKIFDASVATWRFDVTTFRVVYVKTTSKRRQNGRRFKFCKAVNCFQISIRS